MSMLVIRTQYRENYGTTEQPYWKNKGGQEYKVFNVNLNKNFGSEVVAKVESLIIKNNDFQEEYIVDWSWESDDYLSWFEQSQLEYDGGIQFREPEFDYANLCGENV
jgi:uncharacterized radical SAM superfamily Fe-S cluster-containing enzyme